MVGKAVAAVAIVLLLSAAQSGMAETAVGEVTCADLHWSADVLAANPDIALACQGVYEKDGVLYARASIEIIKVQGNSLKFRTLRTDGSKGIPRSVKLDSSWRVELDGRAYRARDLTSGQKLDIYLPEDRFALTVVGSSHVTSGKAVSIEAAEE